MEQALWTFVVIEETSGALAWLECALTSCGWLVGLTMQMANFGTLTVDLLQHQQELANTTNLVVHHQPNNTVDPTVQTLDNRHSRHSLLMPDQSVQSNVAMIALL